MKPLVSIIIPAYNAEEFLQQSIASVVNQTYDNWELLIINDGSNDNTEHIGIQSARGNNKIKIYNKENGGLSSARNYGMDKAQGEYYYFLDADDMMHPMALEILLDATLATESGISAAKHLKFSDYKKIPIKEFNDLSYKKYHYSEAIEEALYQTGGIDHSAWGKLYHKDIFKEEKFRSGWYEDLDIFYRIWDKSEIITFIDVPLYFYRQHSGSYLHNFNIGRARVLQVIETMKASISVTYPILLKAVKDRQLSACFNILYLMYLNDMVDKEIERYCIENIKKLRFESLCNKKVRLKNKIGILLSYPGFGLIRFFYSLKK